MGASLRRARLGVEGIPNRTTEHDTRGERPAHRSSPGSDVRSATSVKRCHHHTTRLSSYMARPTRTAWLSDADFVLIDWGASGDPYKCDLTRVLVTSKFTPKFEEIYRVVLGAQERAIRAIRPGGRAHDIDAEARTAIDAAGFGGFFDHGLGHGIGMEIHEGPRIRMGSEDVLEVGNVITIEPGIYLPDWGGIRIEDDVLVTEDGCEILSRIPKTIDSVRLD